MRIDGGKIRSAIACCYGLGDMRRFPAPRGHRVSTHRAPPRPSVPQAAFIGTPAVYQTVPAVIKGKPT